MTTLNWRTEVTVYNLSETEEKTWIVFHHDAPAGHSPAARKVLRYRGDVDWSLWIPAALVRRLLTHPVANQYGGFILPGLENGHNGPLRNYSLSTLNWEQFVPAMRSVLDLLEKTTITPGKSVRFYRELPSDEWLNAETHPPKPYVPPPLFSPRRRRRRW